MALRSILLMALMLEVTWLSGCATQHDHSAVIQNGGSDCCTSDDIGAPERWGAANNVVRVENLYISAQPDAEALRIARDNGVGVVINFRPAAEQDWDEEKAATELGVAYYNLPIARGGDSLDAQSINRASELVRQHGDARILLHCSSGNRAAAWFAAHLVQERSMAVEPSIGLASSAGLTSRALRDRVRNYLGQTGARSE